MLFNIKPHVAFRCENRWQESTCCAANYRNTYKWLFFGCYLGAILFFFFFTRVPKMKCFAQLCMFQLETMSTFVSLHALFPLQASVLPPDVFAPSDNVEHLFCFRAHLREHADLLPNHQCLHLPVCNWFPSGGALADQQIHTNTHTSVY